MNDKDYEYVIQKRLKKWQLKTIKKK
jgi:hypothetical protein